MNFSRYRRVLSTTQSEERGLALAFVAIAISVLMVFVALAVDISVSRFHKHLLQVGSDAGALAGVLKLGENRNLTIPAQTEAEATINANVISDNEITSVEVGTWDSIARAFSSPGDGPPYNAVRVSARRTVPMVFSSVLGRNSLTPPVQSIAYLTGAGMADCVIPYGVEGSYLAELIQNGLDYGDIMTVDPHGLGSNGPGLGGNWGKLDIGGNMSSKPNFDDAMVNGACNMPVRTGDVVEQATGFAGTPTGWDERIQINPFVIIPVVTDFGNGNSSVTILGFLVAELIAQSGHQGNGNGNNSNGNGNNGNGQGNGNSNSNNGNGNGQSGGVASTGPGNGSNWSGDIRIVKEFLGPGSGGLGPDDGPFPIARILVR